MVKTPLPRLQTRFRTEYLPSRQAVRVRAVGRPVRVPLAQVPPDATVLELPIVEIRTHETWLQLPMGQGWVASFRLVSTGRSGRRRTAIAELRVHPFEPGAPPGEWSGARRASVPKTSFQFAALRRAVTAKTFDVGLAAMLANLTRQGALAAFDSPAVRPLPEGRKNRGRPLQFGRRYLAELAIRAQTLYEAGARHDGVSVWRQLAREAGVSPAAIGKRLERARALGLLFPTRRGQRGMVATPRAHALADPVAPRRA